MNEDNNPMDKFFEYLVVTGQLDDVIEKDKKVEEELKDENENKH